MLRTHRKHVFAGEFGFLTLHIWKAVLKLPPPLSPPIFTHTSSWDRLPSCHVIRCTLYSKNPNIIFVCESVLYIICSPLSGVVIELKHVLNFWPQLWSIRYRHISDLSASLFVHNWETWMVPTLLSSCLLQAEQPGLAFSFLWQCLLPMPSSICLRRMLLICGQNIKTCLSSMTTPDEGEHIMYNTSYLCKLKQVIWFCCDGIHYLFTFSWHAVSSMGFVG